MRRFLKIFVIALLSIFILMQFYPHPKKNNDNTITKNDFSLTNMPPPAILNILKKSCNDCHSNNTIYPWYAHVQPIAWWLGNHIIDGKKELNFSEFGSYTVRRKYKKLDEMYKQVKEGEMPLNSYTLIHKDAILQADEKKLLLDWVNTEYRKMEAVYPPDSLKRKK